MSAPFAARTEKLQAVRDRTDGVPPMPDVSRDDQAQDAIPLGEEPSSYTDDPMTRLWQDADDRETGAEAVEAIRARRKNLGPEDPSQRH
jgi:hypothetical protein